MSSSVANHGIGIKKTGQDLVHWQVLPPLQAGLACLHNPQEQVQSHAVFKHAFQVHNPEESESKNNRSHGVSQSLTISLQNL